MKAVQYEAYGEADVLKHVTLEKPTPAAHEVLIKVSHAGVNPVDWKLRKGFIQAWPHSFPTIPGWDVAGEVVSAPADAEFKAGDKVFAYTRPAFDLPETHPESVKEQIGLRDGAAAEFVCVPAWKVAPVPTSVSLAAAGSVPLAGLTAYQAIHNHLKVKSGETVVIYGASGGVGSFAAGIALAAGATVYGVCSTANVDYVKGLGVEHVVDYKKAPVQEQLKGVTVDAVFDCVGDDATLTGIAVLRDGGRIASIANWGVADLAAKDNGKTGVSFLVNPSGTQLRELAALIDADKVKIPAIKEYPFADIADAHRASESGRTVGKLVLVL